MAIVRQDLTGSTNGRGIAIATAGITVHTATTATSAVEEVHLWFVHNGASTATLSVYMGTTGVADEIIYELPAKDGLHLVVPGLFLASGLICAAFAGATGMVGFGFINRLTTGA